MKTSDKSHNSPRKSIGAKKPTKASIKKNGNSISKTPKSTNHFDIQFNVDKTKDLILKESLKIITELGIQNLSMREVARNLGISHGTPYRHFSTKEDVVIELGIIGFRLFVDTLESDLPVPTTKEILLKRFKKLKDNYIRYATENPELYNIIFNTKLPENEDNPELKFFANKSFSILVNQVASMKTAGLMEIEDVFSASMLIFTQLHGHIMLNNIGVMNGLIKGFQYDKDISDEIDGHLSKSLGMKRDDI
ncbi:MAG: TetR/AcrR family transcriptional regulator [Leptospira sp.]|nr:TetR/AcrR family transcriptional regulator [Leptospira sp.]